MVRSVPRAKAAVKGNANVRICRDPREWTTCVIPPHQRCCNSLHWPAETSGTADSASPLIVAGWTGSGWKLLSR